MNCTPRMPPPGHFCVFRVGQVVPWPAAPDGVGQVEDLLRTNVVLLYARRGRLCRAKVSAVELAEIAAAVPLLPGMPGDNPFSRGVRPRVKRFDLNPQPKRPLRRPRSAS